MEEEMRNHNCVIKALSRENFAFGNPHKKDAPAKDQKVETFIGPANWLDWKNTLAFRSTV